MGAARDFPRGRTSKAYSRSEDAMIRVYDEAGNIIERLEHASDFKEP
jgi:hypothetical protein